jgi:CheY-like chemotaxis protein/anti-sigma regulatory factor (Ser/Thr protein kinase)
VKDEFLATLSHELRTPLNAVLGWAHMLRTGALRPDVQERALQSLERNAKAQAQLVDDLLDVSRIMSGKLAIKSEALDLTAVIALAVDAVRPAVTAKGLRLGVTVDADAEIVVDGDADRLQQIVWNLLSNAAKFTPSSGTIDVVLRNDGDHVEVIVRDTGEGIDPAFLPHVFERFRQADSAPTRRHGGLGLGLAIVRHLTEAHGGTVAAESDGYGTGATFIVRLPVQPGRREPRAPVMAETPATADQVLAGLRILVVDDETDTRELTRVVLESHGGQVVTVASAGEALHALRHQTFDALVADIGMPGQDGYALIRAIRTLPAARGGATPAIAVTAYANLRERRDALAAGFNDHVGKPVDPEDLVAAVTAAIGSKPASEQPSP